MAVTQLKHVNPRLISNNPDNPRLIFRQDELDSLAASIQRVGILVPLAVYEKPGGRRYVLVDGERRWRCAKKLNLSTVPVIVEPKPTKLENILRMFDIHNVRVQWDLLAVSQKLKEIDELLAKELKPHSANDIAGVTGLSLATVRRAYDLQTLPRRYLKLLRAELEKPKSQQQFSEDLFIEMLKALRVVAKYLPQALTSSRDELIQVFFDKYKRNVIKNVVAFRKISKIARGGKLGVPSKLLVANVQRLINQPEFTIEEAYGETVRFAYEERELLTSIKGLTERLDQLVDSRAATREIRNRLKTLGMAISRVLEK